MRSDAVAGGGGGLSAPRSPAGPGTSPEDISEQRRLKDGRASAHEVGPADPDRCGRDRRVLVWCGDLAERDMDP